MSESGGTSDLDKTDELPVLSEEAIVAAGGEYPEFARGLPDDPAVHGSASGNRPQDGDDAYCYDSDPTSELTAPRLPAQSITPGHDPVTDAASADTRPEQSAPSGVDDIDAVETLGRDIAALTARWSGLEGVLENNATAIATLQAELAESRRELSDSNARQRALLTELASNRADSTDRDGELESARTAVREAAAERDRARTRAQEFEASLTQAQAQLQALEPSLADAAARAKALEAELATAAERAESCARERDAAQATAAERERELASVTQALSEAREAAKREPDADVLQPFRDRIASLETYITGRNDRWTEMERLVATQTERIAELEREVAHRSEREQRLEERIQDDARLAKELRAKVAELAAVRAEEARAEEARVEETRADGNGPDDARAASPEMVTALASAKKELDEARGELARLERKLAREPILQREHKERSDETVVSIAPRSAAQTNRASPELMPPVLVCLTSDEPIRYVIDREEMRIGRGPDCDIRIATHFVSREHAGLMRENGCTVIEDRKSTNGVFVNAVRVDRKELEHGDWVTIGETQFRYLSEDQ